MKTLVVSHVLPPSWSGQAMILYRLLKDFPPDSYCLASSQDYSAGLSHEEYAARLPARHYHLPPLKASTAKRGKVRRLLSPIRFVASFARRTRQIAAIIKAENCQNVIACSGDLLDMPTAFVASKLCRVKYYPYLFDDFVLQCTVHWMRTMAAKIEPFLMKGAAAVIVPNEFMGNEIKRRQGVNATVVRNACEPAQYKEGLTPTPGFRLEDDVRIVYTGAVYDAHYDAFRNLVQAINRLTDWKMKLHLYTAQDPAFLAKKGIHGPVVFHNHQKASLMPAIQQSAHILFLPLAFESPYPALIKTSCPGKMGEYLAAGRPILFHVPQDSFVAWYARKEKLGEVADQNDPEVVVKSLLHILSDEYWRNSIATNAQQCAATDFSLNNAQDTLAGLLGLNIR